MKNEAQIRQQLIQNAIHIVASGGFQEATTKALTQCNEDSIALKINEAYIYRLFDSKEGLYAAAFTAIDASIFAAFWQEADRLGDFSQDTKEKFYTIFLSAWKFILDNENNCRYYVRFYHWFHCSSCS